MAATLQSVVGRNQTQAPRRLPLPPAPPAEFERLTRKAVKATPAECAMNPAPAVRDCEGFGDWSRLRGSLSCARCGRSIGLDGCARGLWRNQTVQLGFDIAESQKIRSWKKDAPTRIDRAALLDPKRLAPMARQAGLHVAAMVVCVCGGELSRNFFRRRAPRGHGAVGPNVGRVRGVALGFLGVLTRAWYLSGRRLSKALEGQHRRRLRSPLDEVISTTARAANLRYPPCSFRVRDSEHDSTSSCFG